MQTIIEQNTGPAAEGQTATIWCGWYRPNKYVAWTKLAEADGYGECWSLLLDVLHEKGLRNGDSLVIQRDVDPNKGACASSPARPLTL